MIAPVKPLPKKGDLLDLNNWHRITLLDCISKVVSIFLNSRLQKLLKKNGTPYQFGATPNLGCQDAVFSLKSFLQECREKGMDTYLVFIDLVKAYDSIQYQLIKKALNLLGAPPNIINWILKLYSNF